MILKLPYTNLQLHVDNLTYLGEFEYGKFLIVPVLVGFSSISGCFGVVMSTLAQLYLANT